MAISIWYKNSKSNVYDRQTKFVKNSIISN